MPTSALENWPAIIHLVETAEPHRTVLDVGPGYGKASVLLREYLNVKPERIDAIEAWPGYVTPRLLDAYDDVVIGSVLDLDAFTLARYDVVLMIDVIEHLPKPEALALLERMPGWVIVCTPRDFFSNGPGHPPTEAHVSHWSVEDYGDRVESYDLDALKRGAVLVRLRPLDMRGADSAT